MSYQVVIRPSAAADIAEVYAWYEAQETGLGSLFLEAFDTLLKSIAAGPQRFPVVVRDAKRGLLARFPYSVYFRVRESEIASSASFISIAMLAC